MADGSARGVRAQSGPAARRRSRRDARRRAPARPRSRARSAGRRRTASLATQAAERRNERSKRSVYHRRQRLTSEHERVLSCAFSGRESRRCHSPTEDRFSCARWNATRGNDRRARVRSAAIRMRLGRGTRPRRESAQPGREAAALTGRDTRRGHGGSSSRRKSAVNTVRRRSLPPSVDSKIVSLCFFCRKGMRDLCMILIHIGISHDVAILMPHARYLSRYMGSELTVSRGAFFRYIFIICCFSKLFLPLITIYSTNSYNNS